MPTILALDSHCPILNDDLRRVLICDFGEPHAVRLRVLTETKNPWPDGTRLTKNIAIKPV